MSGSARHRAKLALAAGLLVLPACDESGSGEPPAVRERSQAVAGSGTATGTGTAPHAPHGPSGVPARKLCVERPLGRAPEGRIEVASAVGAPALPTPIAFGVGKWVWLNLWAAWCGPCKEEMPRLRAWQRALERQGVRLTLAFVSVDDDEREMHRFLSSQPEGGVRSTYWLPEDKREKWLAPLGLGATPRLPAHALVSPKGEVACVIDGALEDADFAQFKALFTP